jgi:hypothetical protein
MGFEITDVITDLVFQADPDLEARLEAQAEALHEIKCTNPVLGQWIDENEVNYLLATLALKDEDFAAEFPTVEYIPLEERRNFIEALEVHLAQCPHCSLKRGYDLEMDARIEQVCQQNDDSLLEILKEHKDVAESSDEGINSGMEVKPALMANQ